MRRGGCCCRRRLRVRGCRSNHRMRFLRRRPPGSGRESSGLWGEGWRQAAAVQGQIKGAKIRSTVRCNHKKAYSHASQYGSPALMSRLQAAGCRLPRTYFSRQLLLLLQRLLLLLLLRVLIHCMCLLQHPCRQPNSSLVELEATQLLTCSHPLSSIVLEQP